MIDANIEEVDFSIQNSPLIKTLFLIISGTIDDAIVGNLIHLQKIQDVHFKGKLSYFDLDNFVNLRELSLNGTINEHFNFELFKNLCNKLVILEIFLENIDEKTLVKLFGDYTFPYLENFHVRFANITILKKEFIIRFPKLKNLFINSCHIKFIEKDSFSNLEKLCCLDLRANQIISIEENAFSKFKNIKRIDLSNNQIISIEENAFSKLNNLEQIDLSNNVLETFDPKFVGLKESIEFNIQYNKL
jgi:Leucine-rich repeat (LRR) protein